MTDHDPHTCPAACTDSHNGTICACCGGPLGERYTVSYLLGRDTTDDQRWGTFRQADRWITFCEPCDATWTDTGPGCGRGCHL